MFVIKLIFKSLLAFVMAGVLILGSVLVFIALKLTYIELTCDPAPEVGAYDGRAEYCTHFDDM
jgi:hypothetical protein